MSKGKVDKLKIAKRIIAAILALAMVLSVAATLIYVITSR